jgi:excisionase family DNA binding protein
MAVAINMREAIKPSDCDHPLLKIYLGIDPRMQYNVHQGELFFCVECGERYYCNEKNKKGEKTMDQEAKVGAVRQPLTMTPREVSELMGCSTQHIYDLHRRGQLPMAFKFGGSLLIGKKALKEWLEDKFGTDLDEEFDKKGV